MKQKLILSFALFMASILSMNAQVTIGSSNEPTKGSILDLQSGGNKGLLLPKVALDTDDLTQLKLDPGATKALSKGMMVYNLSDDHVYIWNGTTWKMINESGSIVTDPVLADEVNITTEISQVLMGQTVTFDVEVLPSNTTDKSIIWSVINGSGSATITESGMLTPKSTGKVTVKAINETGNKFDTKEITITAGTGMTVFPEPSTITIPAEGSDTERTTPQITVSNQDCLISGSYTINISGSDVELRDVNLSTGTFKVYFTTENIETSPRSGLVVVKDPCGNIEQFTFTQAATSIIPVTSVAITTMTTSISVGETLKMEAKVNPVNATNQTITWSKTNGTGLATINSSSGVLSPISGGTITVTAYGANGKSDSKTLTITDGTVVMTIGKNKYKTYTYTIGGVKYTWMLENSKEGTSYYASKYNSDSEKQHGYYYTYTQANMTNNACPTGWHLPSEAEMEVLDNFLSSHSEHETWPFWNGKREGALAGYYSGVNGQWTSWGYAGWWWSTYYQENTNWIGALAYQQDLTWSTSWLVGGNNRMLTVRCIKN